MFFQGTLVIFAASLLTSPAVAAVTPDAITVFRAVQKPAPLPGTPLNATSSDITFRVPGSDVSLTFRNYGKKLYQTDISLCLLEGMSDQFVAAVKNKGDGYLATNKFSKSYGDAIVVMNSYSPPAYRMTYGQSVTVLRGLGLFMSLYGYFGVDFDVYSRKAGHVGIGMIG
ncbi:MAG: hypothetical protein Q9170_001773 [Blastenia crenularia]